MSACFISSSVDNEVSSLPTASDASLCEYPSETSAATASFVLLFIGLILYSQPLFLVGIVLFSLTTVFQLVTLPVEFNASHRALETIEGQGLLDGEELSGARKVLRAAALTYVAALLMSLLQLLRYVLIFLGRGGRRGGDE